MRVKIGNDWHEPEPGKPFMIEFDPDDRLAIAMMPEGTNRLAFFDKDDAEAPSEDDRLPPGEYTLLIWVESQKED